MKRSKKLKRSKRISHSRTFKRLLASSRKHIHTISNRSFDKSSVTRMSLPNNKYIQPPSRRSYLTKDLTKLGPILNKKRSQASWFTKLTSQSSLQTKMSINVGHYYRSPRTECKRHGYNQKRCNNDPRCIMNSRGCQIDTIGNRHVIKR
jgi:hypothetical protein